MSVNQNIGFYERIFIIKSTKEIKGKKKSRDTKNFEPYFSVVLDPGLK